MSKDEKVVGVDAIDEDPKASVELIEAQPGQPVQPEAPDLPEGAELEAMVDAGELASVAEGEEPFVTEEAEPKDAPKSRRGRKAAKQAAEKAEADDTEALKAKVEEAQAGAAKEETSPHEPDGSPDEEGASLEMPPEEDLPGIITKRSKDMFRKLTSAWLGAGKPTRLTAFGGLWIVVDDGAKFVSKGAPGSMGDYGSLSTGYAKG
ncbi:MAG: hypothetical protein KAJ73_03175 [Zetaproteobacteria bacterium]|nr:hypothetical protein [Zetaproteobacteria bacterium]